MYIARRDGRDVRIPFALDMTRVAPERYQSGEGLTRASDGSVVMLDSYASRAPAGPCTDGRETFVRVFSMESEREVFSTLAASCLAGIAAGEPVVSVPDADSFRIEGASPRTYSYR